jgi:asparagine synthase (glutamine-hydrolysing)
MSGFIAAFNLGTQPITESLLDALTKSMNYRGPQGRAIWCANTIGLGQANLISSDDCKPSVGPMRFGSDYVIVGNVRVDDQRKLRRRLSEDGLSPAPDCSDLELVVQAYRRWGTDCPEYLLGDYGFALWDIERGQLFCARDPFGLVPVYYSQVGQALLVSNCVRAIRGFPGIDQSLNDQSILELLSMGRLDTNTATAFKAISRLEGGHSLVAGSGRWSLQPYFRQTQPTMLDYSRAEDYIDEFSRIFEAAVGDRMRTRKLTFQLSGGLDTCAVVAAACHLRGADRSDFRTVTWEHGAEELNLETPYATLAAEHLGLSHTIYDIENYRERVPDCEQPPQPSKTIFRHLRSAVSWGDQHSPILFSGLGGDPIFTPDDCRSAQGWPARLRALYFHYQIWGLRHFGLGKLLGSKLALDRKTKFDGIYPPWFLPEVQDRQPITKNCSDRPCYDMLDHAFWRDLLTWGEPEFHRTPVQAVYPFFDLRLWRFCLSLPVRPWLNLKPLLRLYLRGKLPEQIVLRPKTLIRTGPSPGQTLAMKHPNKIELRDLAALNLFLDPQQVQACYQDPNSASFQYYLAAEFAAVTAHWIKSLNKEGV